MDGDLKILVAFVILLSLLMAGIFWSKGPQFSSNVSQNGPRSSQSSNQTEIVSKDPHLDGFDPVQIPESYEQPFDVRWFLEDDKEHGVWRLNGVWSYVPSEISEEISDDSLIIHPWTKNPESPEGSKPSYISQKVEIPSNKEAIAVMEARNGAYFLENVSGSCRDSKAILEVRSGGEVLKDSKIVRKRSQKLVIDLSVFSGGEVELIGKVQKADSGCGVWQGEYLLIDSLYIEV